MIKIDDWTLVTPEDEIVTCPKVYGRISGHPTISNGAYGYASSFEFFDRTTKIGIGLSGKVYQLKNFKPRKNMENEEKAFEMIEKSYAH